MSLDRKIVPQSPTVAITRCSDYGQVEAALDHLLDSLGGWGHWIHPGERVLIKPNLLGAVSVESGVATHPAIVRAIARRVQELGAAPFLGDSPAFGTAPKAARAAGLMDVAKELGIPVVDLDQPVSVSPPPGAKALRTYKLSRWVVEADAIINVPKLKVHRQMQMTGAIKNLFGCVAGKRKARLHFTHGQDRVRFATMLLEYAQVIRPRLTITDAVFAMERMGPRHGDLYPLGLLTAGADVVALDSVHWALLGQPAETLDLLKAARQLKMGESQLERIPIIGVPVDEVAAHDFRMAPQLPVTFSPFRILKSTLKHLWAKRVAAL